jgi:hypothetical protein
MKSALSSRLAPDNGRASGVAAGRVASVSGSRYQHASQSAKPSSTRKANTERQPNQELQPAADAPARSAGARAKTMVMCDDQSLCRRAIVEIADDRPGRRPCRRRR